MIYDFFSAINLLYVNIKNINDEYKWQYKINYFKSF